MGWNLGQTVSDLIGGIDLTPGFNIARADNGFPIIAASGTNNLIGTGSLIGTGGKVLGAANANGQKTTPGDRYAGQTNTDGYGTGSGSGTNSSGYTKAEVNALGAQYDTAIEALRRQLGLVDTTRQQGLDELNTTYSNQLGQGTQKYATQLGDNERDRVKTLENVDNTAANGYQNLRRLIGLSGSANQSALQNAKFAVSKDASGKRQNAIDVYGKNERDINSAEAQFKQNLLDEKNSREKSFLQGLLEQKNTLESSLGEKRMNRAALTSDNYDAIKAAYAPSQAAIDANNAAMNDLTTKYRTPLATTADAPQLSDYTVDKTAINASNQSGEQEYSPYSAFLLRKKLTGQA